MVVFLNPHVDDFLARPPHFFLGRRRPLKKYGFYFEQKVERRESIYVCTDYLISCFIPAGIFLKLPLFVRKFVSKIELLIWRWVNQEISSSLRIFNIEKLSKEHLIFMFSYKNAIVGFPERLCFLRRAGTVIAHLSHYFISTSVKSNNLRQIENLILAGDSDITNVPYFKYFFNWYSEKFYVFHFAVGDKFLTAGMSGERNGLAVTGTFHNLAAEFPMRMYSDFRSVQCSNSYHFARSEFWSRKSTLPSWVKVKCSPFRESSLTGISCIAVLFRRAFCSSAQSQYFNFDILEFYRSSKFALVGEELSGFPAIGIFEAGVVGCIMIGNPQCYVGLGLEAGVDYLPYSGAVDDALELVELFERDHVCIEDIRDSGCSKVRLLFSPSNVFDRWTLLFAEINRGSGKI